MKLNGEMRGRDWATLLWAVGLICVTLLMLTWSISPWSQWDWAGQTAAAWVQAVGSIGAIVGAIVIAARQNRNQRELLWQQINEESSRRFSDQIKKDFDDGISRAAEKRHLKQQAEQRRLAQYRRVHRAAGELVSMCQRALTVEVQRGRNRFDPDEISDLRARLRFIEESEPPEESSELISLMRDIMSTIIAEQHMHSGPAAIELWMGRVKPMVDDIASRALMHGHQYEKTLARQTAATSNDAMSHVSTHRSHTS